MQNIKSECQVFKKLGKPHFGLILVPFGPKPLNKIFLLKMIDFKFKSLFAVTTCKKSEKCCLGNLILGLFWALLTQKPRTGFFFFFSKTWAPSIFKLDHALTS